MKKLGAAKKLGEADNIFYTLGLIGIGASLIIWLVYRITGFSVFSIRYPCVFRSVTGLWCPGCGGTRSVRWLLHGNIWQSFIDYPPVPYGAAVYLIFMIRCFFVRHFKFASAHYKDGVLFPYMYAGLILVGVQWIVKLIAQIGFGVSWIR